MLCGPMNRLQKLNECLEIARKFKNPDMERNLLLAIEEERKNPCSDIYPDPTDDWLSSYT